MGNETEKTYNEVDSERLLAETKIQTDLHSSGDLLHRLKGKHRAAMFTGIEIANAKIEKKVEVALKNKSFNKKAKFLGDLARERAKLIAAVDSKILKKMEIWMAKEGLTEVYGVYNIARGDCPSSIYWYGLDQFKRIERLSNPFLVKELWGIKQDARKDLQELRANLLAIQETGAAKPRPVNFPEPIRTELQKFENKGLLVASTTPKEV